MYAPVKSLKGDFITTSLKSLGALQLSVVSIIDEFLTS